MMVATPSYARARVAAIAPGPAVESSSQLRLVVAS